MHIVSPTVKAGSHWLNIRNAFNAEIFFETSVI